MAENKIFSVKMPDGTITKVNAPADSPEKVVFDFALENYNAKKSELESDKRVRAFRSIEEGNWSKVEVDEEEFGAPYSYPVPINPYGVSVSPTPVKNPRYFAEERRLQEENLVTAFADVLNVPKDNIDIESGLGFSIRSSLSFQPEYDDKLAILRDNYGDDNVLQFDLNGKPNFMVYTDGKYVLVDELGATIEDAADTMRENLVTLAEFAPILNLKKGVTPLKFAFDVGKARTKAEFGAEFVEEMLSLGIDEDAEGLTIERVASGDYSLTDPILKGIESGAFEYGFAKGFDLITRVASPSRMGEDLEFDKLGQAIEELNQKYGTNLELTPGMKLGPDMARREAQLADTDPFFAERRKLFRNTIAQIEEAIKKGETGSFEDVVMAWKGNYEELLNKQADYVAQRDVYLRRSWDNYTAETLENLSVDNVSEKAGANNVRRIFQQHLDNVSSTVNSKYAAVEAAADGVPDATYLEVAQTLIDSLPNVPKDTRDRILASFLPPQARKLLIQSGQLKGAIPKPGQPGLVELNGDSIQLFLNFEDEIMPTLSFMDLVEMRKQLGKIYGSLDASKNNVDKKTISDAIRGIDDLLETKARSVDSDAFVLLEDANKFFRNEKLPLLEDRKLMRVLQKNSDGVYISGDDDLIPVLEGVFSKNNPVRFTQLDRMRSLSPNPEVFDQQVVNYISSRIRKQFTMADGGISMTGLTKLLRDPDLMERYFSKDVIKDLQFLNEKYMKIRNSLVYTNPGALKIPDSLLNDFLTVSDPAARKQIMDQIQLSVGQNNRVILANKNKILQELGNPSPNILLNEEEILDAMVLMKASDIQDLFDFLPEQSKEILKAKLRTRLIDTARYGSNTKTGIELGSKELADGNVLYDIVNNPSTKKKMQVIFNEDELRDLNNLAVLLRESGEIEKGLQPAGLLEKYRSPGSGETFSNSRYIMSGKNTRVYHSLRFDSMLTKLMGIAMRSPTIMKLMAGRGAKADELFKNLLPAVLASSELSEILLIEMGVDPRFSRFIQDEMRTSDDDRVRAYLKLMESKEEGK